ncbi:MAG: DUF5131 family protein [Pirellulales bacterium]
MHCYAETFAERFRGVPGIRMSRVSICARAGVTEPFTWSRPRMVFVNSMSDLFHESVPDDYIAAVVEVMVRANWHVYQVLTKRSERMRDLLKTRLRDAARQQHIWWGVSVENRRHGLPRVAHLRAARTKMSFLSIEPLLEHLGEIDLRGMDWVIVGGETTDPSGPCSPGLSTSAANAAAGVPFFFKQWGGVRKRNRPGTRWADVRRVSGGATTADVIACGGVRDCRSTTLSDLCTP